MELKAADVADLRGEHILVVLVPNRRRVDGLLVPDNIHALETGREIRRYRLRVRVREDPAHLMRDLPLEVRVVELVIGLELVHFPVFVLFLRGQLENVVIASVHGSSPETTVGRIDATEKHVAGSRVRSREKVRRRRFLLLGGAKV